MYPMYMCIHRFKYYDSQVRNTQQLYTNPNTLR